MKAESSMNDDFHLLTLEQFWIKRLSVNSKLASLAFRVPVSFSSISKTKRRNCLDVDSDLMIALIKTESTVNQLVLNMQSHVTH
nr:unnamed protein product [Callosobruchus analis]